MSAVGNKLANEFYENKMPTGYRKPGPHSSPEECRRFVDDKYIRKNFCPKGYPEPVKEFLSARDQGVAPEFAWAKEHHGQNEEHHHHSKSQDHADTHSKPMRKKSLSLDKMPEKKTHHQEDLLSADFDLMGAPSHSHSNNDFGEFKESPQHHAHSASPQKTINFDNFKKANATTNTTTTNSQNSHWAWDMSNLQQTNGTKPNEQGGSFQNGNQNTQQQQQQTQQPENKSIDIMKLYNQPTQQNNFYGHQQQHHGGWNQTFGGGWNAGMNMQQHHGNMQQQQGFYQGGFQQQQNPYGMQQQFHQQQNGHFQHMNGFGGQNMGFGGQMSGFAQTNNNGFVQQTQMNKFF